MVTNGQIKEGETAVLLITGHGSKEHNIPAADIPIIPAELSALESHLRYSHNTCEGMKRR